MTETAAASGISRKALSELVNERASLSPDMTERIARATKTTAESWINMQSKRDLWKSEQKDINVIPFPTDNADFNDILEG